MLAQFPILQCATPDAWLEKALAQPAILLIDHAHCERKAAAMALTMICRYPEQHKLVDRLSRLAREELRHFEQVVKLMRRRDINFQHLTASRYAGRLLQQVRTHEPAKLIDTLIIAAFIEARSCERFAALIPHLDTELATFYRGLLAAEARHYQHYIDFAQQFTTVDLGTTIELFAALERQLIESPDQQFRFHSGI